MSRSSELMMAIDIAIGKKIKNIRIMRGLTRNQVGELIGVTHQQLHKYEKGTNRITCGRLVYLAKALNMPVSYFFEDLDTDMPADVQNRLNLELAKGLNNLQDRSIKEALLSLVKVVGG